MAIKKLIHVVGARPNFMKVAPVMDALKQCAIGQQILLHTGQHYDANMSDIFFHQLGLPQPDINLEVGSGSHAWQTAQIMVELEKFIAEQEPDMVLVYGDVNSTVAASLVCAKLCIPLAHVEAGLRSFDRTMPEEINRIVTDQLADMLFTPSGDGDENLLREGIPANKIFLVGNVMIDTLVRLLPQAKQHWSLQAEKMGISEKSFGLVTLHRPSNVDDPQALLQIMAALDEISQQLRLLFPIHPRTVKKLSDLGWQPKSEAFSLVPPLGYLGFVAIMSHASLVITDSGGIQEETTYLGIPCLTVRENTERPITTTVGTNKLVGQDMDRLRQEVELLRQGKGYKGHVPPLWDGQAGTRIADHISSWFGK
jgi:UDP-N-acetylglucosamine 2-epimerase (non-hydrolysing)